MIIHRSWKSLFLFLSPPVLHLLCFLEEFYSSTLDEVQIHFLDTMRKLRSDIQYRGREIAEDYLDRNIALIEEVIDLLHVTVEKELHKRSK
jgi:hypothetical protein